jgi:PhnB protein
LSQRLPFAYFAKEVSMPVKGIPQGFHTITPGLICKNASAAIGVYKKAFGAVEVNRMADRSGRIMHAELQIGDSRLFLK